MVNTINKMLIVSKIRLFLVKEIFFVVLHNVKEILLNFMRWLHILIPGIGHSGSPERSSRELMLVFQLARYWNQIPEKENLSQHTLDTCFI